MYNCALYNIYVCVFRFIFLPFVSFSIQSISIDDIISFLNGLEREAMKIQEILKIFCMAIGMEINA
jgi:hypothetical protein